MDADQPVIAPSACPISPTAQDQRPLALAPIHVLPPSEMAATETSTQCNANRMLWVVTNCLNRVHSQAASPRYSD
jgi:hypothetical protein